MLMGEQVTTLMKADGKDTTEAGNKKQVTEVASDSAKAEKGTQMEVKNITDVKDSKRSPKKEAEVKKQVSASRKVASDSTSKVLTESEMKRLPDAELLRMGSETIELKLSDDEKFMSHFNSDFNSYRLEKELKKRGYTKVTRWVSCNDTPAPTPDGVQIITLRKPEAKAKRQSLSLTDDGTYEKYKDFYKVFPYPSEITKLALTMLMDKFDKGEIEFRFGK